MIENIFRLHKPSLFLLVVGLFMAFGVAQSHSAGMQNMSGFSLEIDNKIYTGWQDVTVSRSMERVNHVYSLTVANSWRTDTHRDIRAGDAIRLLFDDELISTGYIDHKAPEYNAKSQFLKITGRSKTQDLVDSTVVNQSFKEQSLLQIAQQICKPFGIDVVDLADSTQPFLNEQKIDEGQTPFDFLEQMARVRAVRLMESPDGKLLLTRANLAPSTSELVLGNNILKASGKFSYQERFSIHTVLSNQDAGLFSSPDAAAHPAGIAIDETVRYRPMTVLNDDPADIETCTQRAQWQLRTNLGRSQQVVYTTVGAKNSDGLVWSPNELVYVDDEYQGISGDRLIVESVLKVDANGVRSELMVMPAQAFTLEPLPEPSADASGLFG